MYEQRFIISKIWKENKTVLAEHYFNTGHNFNLRDISYKFLIMRRINLKVK